MSRPAHRAAASSQAAVACLVSEAMPSSRMSSATNIAFRTRCASPSRVCTAPLPNKRGLHRLREGVRAEHVLLVVEEPRGVRPTMPTAGSPPSRLGTVRRRSARRLSGSQP